MLNYQTVHLFQHGASGSSISWVAMLGGPSRSMIPTFLWSFFSPVGTQIIGKSCSLLPNELQISLTCKKPSPSHHYNWIINHHKWVVYDCDTHIFFHCSSHVFPTCHLHLIRVPLRTSTTKPAGSGLSAAWRVPTCLAASMAYECMAIVTDMCVWLRDSVFVQTHHWWLILAFATLSF